jgi:hypothetical protein
MLLRASGAYRNEVYDPLAVMTTERASGVACGDVLVELVDAVMEPDEARRTAARAAVVEALGPQALIDAAAVIAMFHQADRVADGAGIPLDEPLALMTRDLRSELGVERFTSAANTPRA